MRELSLLLVLVCFVLAATACGSATESNSSAVMSSTSTVSSTSTTSTSTAASSTQTSLSTTATRKPVSRTTVSRTTTTTTATTTANEFAQPKVDLVGKAGDKNHIYRFGESGLIVRETTVDSGRGGEAVEIVQITDAHIGFAVTQRLTWQTALRYAAEADYTVATGDIIEGLHTDLTKWLKDSLAKNPNTMLVLGNHEWNPTKGTPETMDARYDMLQDYWPNDVVYSSVVVKNKVMLIGLDNSQSKFWDSQIPKLEADIKTARTKGYAVLLFYHIPLRTENSDELKVKALLPTDPKVINTYNFRSGQLRGKENDATDKIYSIITNNADVIKGAFCGHLHEDIYTEIVAKTPDGADAVIPQYINHANRYGAGHVLKITVK